MEEKEVYIYREPELYIPTSVLESATSSGSHEQWRADCVSSAIHRTSPDPSTRRLYAIRKPVLAMQSCVLLHGLWSLSFFVGDPWLVWRRNTFVCGDETSWRSLSSSPIERARKRSPSRETTPVQADYRRATGIANVNWSDACYTRNCQKRDL